MEVKRIMVISNLRSGLGKGKKYYQRLIKWRDSLTKEKGIEVYLEITEKSGQKSAFNLAKLAIKEKYDLIISSGGDGTANEVANGVVGTNTPVLFLSAGSGNDFSKALRIPQEVDKALNLIFQGKLEAVDLGKVNERVFVNVFGVGFDAKVVEYAENLRKRWHFLPLVFLYLVALLRELLFKIEYLPLAVTILRGRKPSERMIGRVTLVAIANGPSCGGGIFRLAPRAYLRDGLLDICWVGKISRLRIFRFFPRVIKGNYLSLPEVKTVSDGRLPQASSLVIASLDNQNLPCQMDGEVLLPEKEYRISLLPKALKVLVP